MSIPHRLPDKNEPLSVPTEAYDPSISTKQRIRHLLRANPHTIWQSDIVDALDVTKATVSRHLTDLERYGEIERMEYRGRKMVELTE